MSMRPKTPPAVPRLGSVIARRCPLPPLHCYDPKDDEIQRLRCEVAALVRKVDAAESRVLAVEADHELIDMDRCHLAEKVDLQTEIIDRLTAGLRK